MVWPEAISAAFTAANIAREIASGSNFIRKHVSRLHYLIRHGSAKIPIFGAGGVGKSTTGRILTSDRPIDDTTPYDESWLIEGMRLAGDIPGLLIVAPGQQSRVERHWPDLLRQVETGDCFGLINVVSYGYHSFMVPSFKEHDQYEESQSVADFVRLYTEARRDLEIELLKRTVIGIANLREPIWFVTVVCKQDLWWDRRDVVKAHYASGEYSRIISDIETRLGTSSFQHEFIPVSLRIENWTTESGEELAQTVAGYDQIKHLSHLNTLFIKLDELLSQGSPS